MITKHIHPNPPFPPTHTGKLKPHHPISTRPQLSLSPPIAIAARSGPSPSRQHASSSVPLLILMIGGDAQLMPSAWKAADLLWYADFVAHSTNKSRDAPAEDRVSAVLQLDAQPLDQCLLMRGLDALDGRYEDSASQLWSHDRYGRWFAKKASKTVWLQAKVAGLRYGRGPRRGLKQHGPKRSSNEFISHICGNCNCIRLQHIRYQSKSEDARAQVISCDLVYATHVTVPCVSNFRHRK